MAREGNVYELIGRRGRGLLPSRFNLWEIYNLDEKDRGLVKNIFETDLLRDKMNCMVGFVSCFL